MNEHAFLQAIDADRSDDSLRLVYADWLEDQGDPRCDYLRARCSNSSCCAWKDSAWDAAVAHKIDVMVLATDDWLKLDMIKEVKNYLRLTLYEAKVLVDQAGTQWTSIDTFARLEDAQAFQRRLRTFRARVELAPIWRLRATDGSTHEAPSRYEETFLRAIDANRTDDSLRLAYADWLEQQGDSRADYLRSRCDGQPRFVSLSELPIYRDWDLAVARQIEIQAEISEDARRIEFVKVVREALHTSLAEAKAILDLASAGSARIHVVSTLREAFALRAALQQAGATVQLLPRW